MSRRCAGLLLHPTSLPGPFGVGDLGRACDHFLRWAAQAGQTLWQILPLHSNGTLDSPYSSASAFAGNELLLSPELLVEEGMLPAAALADAPIFRAEEVEFEAVRRWKRNLLRACWAHWHRAGGSSGGGELDTFQRSEQQKPWLADWALFAAVKDKLDDRPWIAWPEELARREPSALAAARRELADEVAYQEFVQFLFFRQWDRVRGVARGLGIEILGDVPIYLSHDSADVWARRDLFALDSSGLPEVVAGVPPDYFSETGQLWGYPLYRWDRMEEEGFSWWIERLRLELALADLARLDHFRAFSAYWAVPAGDRDARGGRWLPGPGEALLRAVERSLGPLALVAEDLGTITEDVDRLLAALGLPGMRVLQFAFSEDDSPHAPHRHVRNSVVYTGTHDNDTVRGWFEGLSASERERLSDYVGGDGREIAWDLIRVAQESVADRAVVPVQDVFGLGGQARMNTPSRAEGNWRWRARAEDFTPERAARLRRLAEMTGRVKG